LDTVAHLRSSRVIALCSVLTSLLWLAVALVSAQLPGSAVVAGTSVRVERLREHKNALLREVSSDGSSMILWETDNPVLRLQIPIPRGGSRVPSGTGDNRLVRIEVATGKVMGSISVGWLPHWVHSFPDGRRAIFTHSPGNAANLETLFWEFETNQTTPCLAGQDALAIQDVTPVSDEHLVAMRPRSNNKNIRTAELLRMNAGHCSVAETSPAYPAGESANFTGELSLSPDRRTVAYPVRRSLLLRGVSDLSVVRRFESADWSHDNFRFMLDSQLLLVVLWRRIPQSDPPQLPRRLRVYEIATGRAVRELELGDVGSLGKLAVSPDGKLAALGGERKRHRAFQGRQKQPFLAIYDVEASGEELTRIDFPWGPDDLSYTLNNIEFTRDGKYLLTSTGDTQVWKIIRLEQ
jgi:WD40 repeat protein